MYHKQREQQAAKLVDTDKIQPNATHIVFRPYSALFLNAWFACSPCCVLPQEGALDKLEGFASFHGPAFYGLPRNSGTLTLQKRSWAIPEAYGFGSSSVVPMWAGSTIHWQVAE